MNRYIIHFSDLHYRLHWEEEQGIVLSSLFKDLKKQVQELESSNLYFAFSGDIVKSGEEPEMYQKFFKQFNTELNALNITKEKRICIPGNHDVSQKYIRENSVTHEGVVSQKLNEYDFNNFISSQPEIITDKFLNYKNFETEFAEFCIPPDSISGGGWSIDSNIGVYCLNTALLSSGGFKMINDKNKLAIDTRSLHKWLLDCKATTKILIMHHPIDWLVDWAQIELKKILRNSFNLCLSGHVHNQDVFHTINDELSLIECSAPPLLTNKNDHLGYTIVSIAANGVEEIIYRQWTNKHNFVTGVNFSNTDDGRVNIKSTFIKSTVNVNDRITQILNKRFDNSLRSFASQPIIWVEPILSKTNEISHNPNENVDQKIDLLDFVAHPKSTIIKAPPQFGLTCLAHYMIKEAWTSNSSLWLYLDVANIKSHQVEKALDKELKELGLTILNIKCILIDSWSNSDKDSLKLLKQVSESYKDIILIVMQTIEDAKFISESNSESISREFLVFHLLALPRNHIRKVVATYNDERHIGDEDIVLSKVITDLETLNIHRTPYNCLTLLKVAEKYFDESPVNRTKMLEMVLFLLFDFDDIPTYKTKPDVKDCEYVLGRFSENMIRNNNFYFSREEFIKELELFCSEKLIDLEVDLVFDILYANNIIVSKGLYFGFRSSYWIFYFAAQRMHHDSKFSDYVFEERRYTSYPEIIEFYTGIDRMRDDALEILLNDISSACDTVEMGVGLPDDMNLYKFAEWIQSPESIDKIQNELSENVLNSRLPDSVKDRYADRGYNQFRPYDQEVHIIFQKYSLVLLGQSIKAASRALRNSDYVDPDLKRRLLNQIVRSWLQITNVLIVLAPILAEKGIAAYDGASFYLGPEFSGSFNDKLRMVLDSIPSNVINWYKYDLYSQKMGPLLFDYLGRENAELKRHLLVLLIITERPRNWKTQVSDYIGSVKHNSFYLANLVQILRNQYSYSFASEQELKEIIYLIKMSLAKHKFGTKKPGLDKILKISNENIPKREIDN